MPYHLAQVNIAIPKEPLESELLRDFMEQLDPVNSAADAAPGFVWRLQTDDGDATAVRGFGDDRLIINMSVWESVEALRAFAYEDLQHLAVLRRRREWFEHLGEAYMVLWWVETGHIPTVAEAEERLTLLRAAGPSPDAFTFKNAFPPPAETPSPSDDERELSVTA
jgi:hypothetical protein